MPGATGIMRPWAESLRERVEVRRAGGFERREVTLFTGGDVAQAVEHDERELGVGFQCQFGIECVQIHNSIQFLSSCVSRRHPRWTPARC